MRSWLGLFGPGFALASFEKSYWDFSLNQGTVNFSNVADFIAIAIRDSCLEINKARQTSKEMRSYILPIKARFKCLETEMTSCRRATFWTATLRTPLGSDSGIDVGDERDGHLCVHPLVQRRNERAYFLN